MNNIHMQSLVMIVLTLFKFDHVLVSVFSTQYPHYTLTILYSLLAFLPHFPAALPDLPPLAILHLLSFYLSVCPGLSHALFQELKLPPILPLPFGMPVYLLWQSPPAHNVVIVQGVGFKF